MSIKFAKLKHTFIIIIWIRTDDDEFNAEISPLVSYSGEGLNDLKEKQLKMPVILEKSSDSITFNGLDYSTYII